MPIVDVVVPDIGDADDVDVVEVLVSPGDAVEADDSLITLESDKASMDIPAPQAGVVKELKIEVGGKVGTGDLILTLEISEGAAAAPAASTSEAPAASAPETPAPATPTPATPTPATPAPAEPVAATPPPEPSPAETSGAATAIDEEAFSKAYASPSVRRLARELGVDLGSVSGSGRKGRITRDDLHGFVKRAMASGSGASSAAAGGAFSLPPMPEIDFSKYGEVEVQPLSRIRRISGANLHRSWLHVPHVTQFDEADITEMEAFRKGHQEQAKARGVKLTPVAFLLKACAGALREFPDFNASLDASGESLVLKKYVHIGVAVDTPKGLVVPVVRDVDQKGLFEIAGDLGDLSTKAREGKLLPGDMQGGCFTISSLGGIGGTAFTPIVNAPEVAILGVSRSQRKPVWNGDGFEPRLMLPLSLSYDHRVIDGAAAARFTTYLAGLLSDLRRLLL